MAHGRKRAHRRSSKWRPAKSIVTLISTAGCEHGSSTRPLKMNRWACDSFLLRPPTQKHTFLFYDNDETSKPMRVLRNFKFSVRLLSAPMPGRYEKRKIQKTLSITFRPYRFLCSTIPFNFKTESLTLWERWRWRPSSATTLKTQQQIWHWQIARKITFDISRFFSPFFHTKEAYLMGNIFCTFFL